jgi:hypothetical protein
MRRKESDPMPGLHDVQAAFAAAVRESSADAALTGQIVAAGIPAERRIAIYRANVMLSLRRLLEGTFPATRRLLGAEHFAELADRFVRQRPPERPQLLAYGADFPAFLMHEDHQVADVARLEWAREEAYHAADAPALDAAAVAAIPIERYPGLRLEPHPSLRLIRSSGPVYSLWLGEPKGHGPQQVLIVRLEMTVATRPIAAADLVLVEALAAGRPLGEAATAALQVDPQFDLQAALADHLSGGSFAACR